MNILLLYPKYPETFWNPTGSIQTLLKRQAMMPPLGLLTIAAYLPGDFNLRLIDRNLAEESAADWEWADAVFVSCMLIQEKDYKVCVANARKMGVPIALGGPYTHARPEAEGEVDWICFGEAENVIDSFVEDVRADRRGRSYRGSSDTDMTKVRTPRFELLGNANDYAIMPIQFSRGCPFRCEFCDIIEIYGRVPRTKQAQQVLDELTGLRRVGFEGVVFLVDDNFIGNRKQARILLEGIATWNAAEGTPYRFFTEASLNLAEEDALLDAMANANVRFCFIGLETPDKELLKKAQKNQNLRGDPIERLNRIRSHGVHVTAGFIVGFDGEDADIYNLQREFISTAGIGLAMVGLLEAIPHTQLSRRLIEEKRLLSVDHEVPSSISSAGLNFVPRTAMTKRQYMKGYGEFVKGLYSPAQFFPRTTRGLLGLRRKMVWKTALSGGRWALPFLLRQMYVLGFQEKDAREHFWRAFLTLARENPGAIETFGLECLYYYHLRTHSQRIAKVIDDYLANPSPNDVLDQTLGKDASPVPLVALKTTPRPARAARSAS